MKDNLAIFEDYNIRRVYDEEAEMWLFSVVDVIRVLIQEPDYQSARNYWKVLKNRLSKEGNQSVTNCNRLIEEDSQPVTNCNRLGEKRQSVTNCHRLKLEAADGKKYMTDVANAEALLRIIQSVPSLKAEPIKMWLAKVGYERMQEMADPERSLDRARETWKQAGRSEKWVQQRMMGQETRNKLTDYWKEHEVEGKEFAILTNIIHQEWAEVDIKKHKDLKGLKTQNLRDHMSEAELIFTALAELSTRQVAENIDATGLAENKGACKIGGSIAKNARISLESKTGNKVVSGENYLPTNTKSIK